jgi:hypothetical protein
MLTKYRYFFGATHIQNDTDKQFLPKFGLFLGHFN